MKRFEKKNNTKTAKDATSRKKLRLGGYSIALICIVLALLVAVNLIVGEIPTKYTHIDVSELQLFTLSKENVEFLKTLDQDVTLYLVTENNAENNDVNEILSKYAAENSHIRVVLKDPSLYPGFVSQYTSSTLTDNSIIVEHGEKSKVIDFTEIFSPDYSSYYSTGQLTYYYNGEALITGAIDYVTREDLPVMYTVSGHGESALSDTMKSAIENKNYVINDLALISAEEIPADCDILLIDTPTQDISEKEADLLIDYLEQGGSVLLFTGATETNLPNLMSVAEAYGMTAQSGILCDSDTEHYYQNYLMLLPDKNSHEITSALISDKTYILLPYAHGISRLEQYRSTLTVSPLLSTSDSAYLKADPETAETLEKEAGDAEGTFYLGCAAEETYGSTTSRMVWYSTSLYYFEYADSAVSGANSKLVLSSLDWLHGGETSGINIPAKKMASDASMTLSAAQALLWIAVLMILIPVGILIFGLVYWLKRRKR